MTKEEIQKNSEHWYNKYKDVKKQIEELEKENETLSQNLDDAMSVENCLKKRITDIEVQNKELQCCANCRYSYGGEEEPYHKCGYCHVMQCICKLKLEEHTSDIYRMWEDKCERWEMRVN